MDVLRELQLKFLYNVFPYFLSRTLQETKTYLINSKNYFNIFYIARSGGTCTTIFI